ncbi:MAG: endonuclease/exonuclease/phosphatase family protein [Spirochaetaceae bacterium]
MRRITVSLVLALLLACFVLVRDAAAETVDTSISVVTINAWSGLEEGGFFARGRLEEPPARRFRLKLLAEELAALDADVVTVGEANPLEEVTARLSEATGAGAVSHMAEGGVRIGAVGLPTNLRLGDLILAPEETQPTLVLRRTISGGYVGRSVSFQTGETNQVLGTVLELDGRRVYVFHTRWHESPFAGRENLLRLVEAYREGTLPAEELVKRVERAVDGAERRLSEARRTVLAINEAAGDAPVILTGSLNARPDSEEIGVLTEAGFTDAFARAGSGAGATWDPSRNAHIAENDLGPWDRDEAARLDYIFVRGPLEVREARVVLDEPTYGVYPSARFGVLTRIMLKGDDTGG